MHTDLATGRSRGTLGPRRLDPPSSHPLRAIQWFKTVDDELLAELYPTAQTRTYVMGERIWSAGDEAGHFAFVLRGLVQVAKSTARGEEITLGLFGPSEGLGNIAAMQGTLYPASAIASSDKVTILRLPANVVRGAMDRHPALMAHANAAFMLKAQALLTKIDVLSAGPVSARLALLLLHLAERFGDEAVGGGLYIPIALSRGALARFVSAREETVIRVLSRWRDEQWVSTLPDGFMIHAPDQIESMINEDTKT